MRTRELKKELKKWIIKNYGIRCEFLDMGCACCRVWLSYDTLFSYDDVKENYRIVKKDILGDMK